MGMNQTPASERVHIGFFGRRNAGKSSVMNAVTGQDLAVVSEVKGTTTDPVYKSMELLPMGPVMMIDTPGIDDEGELGALRMRKSYQVLNKCDAAVVVIDAQIGASGEDLALIGRIRQKNIPYVIVLNKQELLSKEELRRAMASFGSFLVPPASAAHGRGTVPVREELLCVSAAAKEGIDELKARIAGLVQTEDNRLRLVGDLIAPSDFVVLVVPIDKAAPKGRLILPQQQTIRDILEADATAVVVKEHELRDTLGGLGRRPSLVITDSQVFAKVSADTPREIPLTSFSILFARYKGNLEAAVRGVAALERLGEGDKILISEGCTHHRQCDDIGTVKLPRWIRQYTGKEFSFSFTSGTEFPDDLSPYGLVIHCGGCMLNEREMKYRASCAQDQDVPMTNYGILIAYMQGILKRSVEIFPEIAMILGQ